MTDIPAGIDRAKLEEVYAAWQDASEGQELVAWDAQRGKELWRFTEARIALDKLAVSGGRVFLYVNASDAVALDLRSGRQLWKSPAPQPDVRPRFGIGLNAQAIMNQNRGEPHALASPTAYVIFDPLHLQYQAFDATDGHQLWTTPMDPKTRWAPGSPLILGDKLFGGGINLLTGEKTDECKNPLTKGGFPSASCGHSTAVESGLWVGYGVIDMKTGQQTAPNMAKAPCGTGFFVADGMEVLYPNTCACRGWHGLMLIRPTAPGKAQATARSEKGEAPPAANLKADASDWTSYRSDETRKGSSAAIVSSHGAIRWTYTPPRPATGKSAADLPAYLERGKYANQVIAVGERVWFGTAEGAVVCLDRQTGVRQWEYWTAGRMLSARHGRMAGSMQGRRTAGCTAWMARPVNCAGVIVWLRRTGGLP